MSYCPQCLTEFQPGVVECSDCRVPLVEGVPLFCPSCEESISPDDTFCDTCGVLLPLGEGKDAPECELHPDRAAVGGCVVCGRPICDTCLRMVDGKHFCSDDEHLNVHQKFVVAYITSTDYEAAMIRANLEGAGIDARIFNQHDHVYFVNMGSLAQVKIMVPTHMFEQSQEVIRAILEGQPVIGDTDEGAEEASEPSSDDAPAGGSDRP